jgi:hypothetical protein
VAVYHPHSVHGASWRSMTQHKNLDRVGAIASYGEREQLQHEPYDRVPNDKITVDGIAELAHPVSHKPHVQAR